jgi:hypothetical protein
MQISILINPEFQLPNFGLYFLNAMPKTPAVLPLSNMSASSEDEYFSDGITEEIINALSKIKSLCKSNQHTPTLLAAYEYYLKAAYIYIKYAKYGN